MNMKALLSYSLFKKLNESESTSTREDLIKLIEELINQGYDAETISSEIANFIKEPDRFEEILKLILDDELETSALVDEILANDSDVINEVDSKDIMRLEDIKKKSNGEESKMISLASTMSKLITDKYKALNRGLAAQQVLGKESQEIANIFFNRAKELGIDSNLIPEEEGTSFDTLFGFDDEGKLGSQMSNPKTDSGKRVNSSILPCGILKIDSGINGHGWSIYENEESTLEIWKKSDGNLVAINTSGTEPIYGIGSKGSFYHDQTGRPLFSAEMIDYVESKNARLLIPKYGKTIKMYVYK